MPVNIQDLAAAIQQATQMQQGTAASSEFYQKLRQFAGQTPQAEEGPFTADDGITSPLDVQPVSLMQLAVGGTPGAQAGGMMGAPSGGAGGAPSGGLYGVGSGPQNGAAGPLMTRNDVTMVRPALMSLIRAGRRTDNPVLGNVVSDYRSTAQQQALYNAYLNGTGNLAAPPGSSNHEKGLAVDISTAFLQRNPEVARYLSNHGWSNTVPGEPWHWAYRTTG